MISCSASLAGKHDQYRSLSCLVRAFLKRDKERCVKSLTTGVEDQLGANDFQPV